MFMGNVCRCPLQPGITCFADSYDDSPSLSSATLTTAAASETIDSSHLNGIYHSALLALPGEIRNRIYRYVLVKQSPFSIKLQFFPLDAALLRVNKQVYREASGIFYHENVFRFREELFTGAPILRHLESFYRVPEGRLRSMRRVLIDLPVCVCVFYLCKLLLLLLLLLLVYSAYGGFAGLWP